MATLIEKLIEDAKGAPKRVAMLNARRLTRCSLLDRWQTMALALPFW